MKSSLIILMFFVIGIIFGLLNIIPLKIVNSNISTYSLYLLMFLVGIGVGGDRKTWKILKEINIKILLVPFIVIVGSLLGTAVLSLFLKDINIKEALAVGAGFGYYSLSSIIITKFHGETLGVVALIANLIREITTILLTPLLAKYFGKLAPIASGGATSMDTTLPIITKFVGKEYAIISVFSGVVLTILVPFLVTFIIK
ncbi:MAG: lysine exporter LysO family protein [Nanoarchaeota archaeon]|mgnify:CR=1 FL=1